MEPTTVDEELHRTQCQLEELASKLRFTEEMHEQTQNALARKTAECTLLGLELTELRAVAARLGQTVSGLTSLVARTPSSTEVELTSIGVLCSLIQRETQRAERCEQMVKRMKAAAAARKETDGNEEQPG